MRAVTTSIAALRHAAGATAEGLIAAALIATLVMAFAPVYAPADWFAGDASAGARGPSLSVSTGDAAARSTGVLSVSGSGFTPSEGGQQVRLWVGYPDDYCSPDRSVCHGFYVNPWVEADGSFSMKFENALVQSGTGTVKASQYSQQTGKWRTVDTATYTVP